MDTNCKFYLLDCSSNVSSVFLLFFFKNSLTELFVVSSALVWFGSQPEICTGFYTELGCPHLLQALSKVFPLLSSGYACLRFSKNTMVFCWTLSIHVQLKSIKTRKFILCYFLLPSVDSLQTLPAFSHANAFRLIGWLFFLFFFCIFSRIYSCYLQEVHSSESLLC